MPEAQANAIEQAWADLASICGQEISRNTIAAVVLENCIKTLNEYEKSGFTHFIGRWPAVDYLYEKEVDIIGVQNKLRGIAKGISHKGELNLQVNGSMQVIHSGEISVRASFAKERNTSGLDK